MIWRFLMPSYFFPWIVIKFHADVWPSSSVRARGMGWISVIDFTYFTHITPFTLIIVQPCIHFLITALIIKSVITFYVIAWRKRGSFFLIIFWAFIIRTWIWWIILAITFWVAVVYVCVYVYLFCFILIWLLIVPKKKLIRKGINNILEELNKTFLFPDV